MKSTLRANCLVTSSYTQCAAVRMIEASALPSCTTVPEHTYALQVTRLPLIVGISNRIRPAANCTSPAKPQAALATTSPPPPPPPPPPVSTEKANVEEPVVFPPREPRSLATTCQPQPLPSVNPLIVAPHTLPPRLAAANDWVPPPGRWITIVTLATPDPASVTTAVKSLCDPIVAPFAGERAPMLGGVESDGGLPAIALGPVARPVSTCSSRGATEWP